MNVSAGGIRRRRARFVARRASPLRAVELTVARGRGRGARCRRRPTASTSTSGCEWATRARRPRQPATDVLELTGEIRPAAAPPSRRSSRRRRRGDLVRHRVRADRSARPACSRAEVSLGELAEAGPRPTTDPARQRRGRRVGPERARRRPPHPGAARRAAPRAWRARQGRASWRSSATARARPRWPSAPRARCSSDAALDRGRRSWSSRASCRVRLGARSSCCSRRTARKSMRSRRSRRPAASPARLAPALVESLAGPLPLARGHLAALLRAARRAVRERPGDGRARARRAHAAGAPSSATSRSASARRQDGDAVLIVRARSRRRRARPLPPAPAARVAPTTRGAARRCATPSSTRASAAGSTPTARARSTRSWCGAETRSSTSGSSATGRARARHGAPRCAHGSREHYELLARARYVVANDHFPDWFKRRGDQVVRADLARHAAEADGSRPWPRCAGRRSATGAAGAARSRTGSTCSRRTASRRPSCAGPTGSRASCSSSDYPRTDALAGPDREARSRGSCAGGSGCPRDKRVVLYAPTYRDHAIDRRGRLAWT